MRVVAVTLFFAYALEKPVVAKLVEEHKHKVKVECRPKASSLLAKSRLDPHCHEGIMNTEMTACCQKDCGECHDGSDICNAKATNGRGSTCCPSDMLTEHLASCENSKAPCAVPAYVRAAPDVNSLKTAEGSRTAIDDCGDAVPDEDERHKLATHFLHFRSQDVTRNSAVEASCGEYGTLAAATAACDRRDDCMGFTWGGSDCLLIAGSALEELSAASHDVYVKVEGSGGRRFVFDPMQYTADCSKACGGGEQTRDIKCKSCKSEEATKKNCEGLEAPLGMCTAQVVMNADAVPSTSTPCNSFACENGCGDKDRVIFHFPNRGNWPSEVSWDVEGATLAPAEGEPLTGEEGPCQAKFDAACCADLPNLHVNCHDSFGDGWNGATMYAKLDGDEGSGKAVCEEMWVGDYYYYIPTIEDDIAVSELSGEGR